MAESDVSFSSSFPPKFIPLNVSISSASFTPSDCCCSVSLSWMKKMLESDWSKKILDPDWTKGVPDKITNTHTQIWPVSPVFHARANHRPFATRRAGPDAALMPCSGRMTILKIFFNFLEFLGISRNFLELFKNWPSCPCDWQRRPSHKSGRRRRHTL